MSQGLNLVCQPPTTIAVAIPERYALAPTVRAQLMAGNGNSWDVVDNHTSLPTGINLQAPQLPVSHAYHTIITICVNIYRGLVKRPVLLSYPVKDQ